MIPTQPKRLLTAPRFISYRMPAIPARRKTPNNTFGNGRIDILAAVNTESIFSL